MSGGHEQLQSDPKSLRLQGGDHTTESPEISLAVKPRFKRRTGGPGGLGPASAEGQDVEESPVVLSAALLKTYFNMPLHAAAKTLGVCATAIKKWVRPWEANLIF
jgi:hypothetical protein